MANPNSPGEKTSELANQKKTQAEIWIMFAMTVIGCIATALLETGQIIDNGWVTMLTLVATAAAGITGKTMLANKYTDRRTALKVAKVYAENPPQSTYSLASGSHPSLTPPPIVKSGEGASTLG